jgi:hypothetical protein
MRKLLHLVLPFQFRGADHRSALAGYYFGATNSGWQTETFAGQLGEKSPDQDAGTQPKRFHANGAPPSKYTIEVLKKARTLPTRRSQCLTSHAEGTANSHLPNVD